MKIAISECLWKKWNMQYPTFWSDEDFFVYIGKTIDLVYDPFQQIHYRQLETVGCLMIGSSAHEEDEDFKGDYGYPLFTNDFIVFKNNDLGRKLFNEFMQTGNITQVMSNNKIMPCLYPGDLVRLRVPPDTQPEITWGKSDK